MQHVCSVAIFVCSFVGIFQERVSPVSVVSWGSAGAVLGWALWDFWVGQEEAIKSLRDSTTSGYGSNIPSSASSTVSSTSVAIPIPVKETQAVGLGLTLQAGENTSRHGSHSHGSHSRSSSATSSHSVTSAPSPPSLNHANGTSTLAAFSYYPPYNAPASPFSPRNQQRLSTLKSAILIYCALLGLSPILKSLTKSTSSDSIWAMSTWLMCIHVFSFDYGGSVGVKSVLPFFHHYSSTTARFRTDENDAMQIPSLPLDKRRSNGLHSPRLPPPFHNPCLLLNPFLYFRLWPLPCLPPPSPPCFLVIPSHAYCISCYRCWRGNGRHACRQRCEMESCAYWSGIVGLWDVSGDGGM